MMNYLSHLVSRGDTGSSLAFGKPPNAPRNSLTTPSTLEGLRRVKKEALGAVPSNPSILVCIAWSSMVAAYASMVATVDVPTTIDTLNVMVTQGMCCIQQAYGSALHCCGLHQSSGHVHSIGAGVHAFLAALPGLIVIFVLLSSLWGSNTSATFSHFVVQV